MSQAWRITIQRGKERRRYVVEEMIEVGDKVRIKETGAELWEVIRKEPTEILMRGLIRKGVTK